MQTHTLLSASLNPIESHFECVCLCVCSFIVAAVTVAVVVSFSRMKNYFKYALFSNLLLVTYNVLSVYISQSLSSMIIMLFVFIWRVCILFPFSFAIYLMLIHKHKLCETQHVSNSSMIERKSNNNNKKTTAFANCFPQFASLLRSLGCLLRLFSLSIPHSFTFTHHHSMCEVVVVAFCCKNKLFNCMPG